jgi:hypothetical protein
MHRQTPAEAKAAREMGEKSQADSVGKTKGDPKRPADLSKATRQTTAAPLKKKPPIQQ